MCFLKWAKKVTKKMSVWDVAVLKTSAAIFGIVLGAYISTFVKQHVWYFVAAFVVLYAWLLYRTFKK